MVQPENIRKNLVIIIGIITTLINLIPCIYSIYILSGNDFSRCNSILSLLLMLLTGIPMVMVAISIINTILMFKENYSVTTIFAWVFIFLYIGMVAVSSIIIISYVNLSDVDDPDPDIKYTATASGSKAKLAALCTLICCALIFVIVLFTLLGVCIRSCNKKMKEKETQQQSPQNASLSEYLNQI